MTIAAGFVAEDGVVVCADSQHTGTMAKFDQKKIRDMVSGDSYLVLGGAGTSDYIDMAGDLIEDKFKKCRKGESSIRRIIKDAVLEVYRNHIIPFWQANDTRAPQVFLIVAARLAGGLYLWKCSETAISRCQRSAFVGIGSETANRLASWLLPRRQTLAVTQVIAKEIMAETKRTVPDCGGLTHLCSMPIKGVISTTAIPASDDGPFLWGLNARFSGMVSAAIDKHVDDANFKTNLAGLVSEAKALRKRTNGVPVGQEWSMLFRGF
jgi:hypothetical protein